MTDYQAQRERIAAVCHTITPGTTITTQELALRCWPKSAAGWKDQRAEFYKATSSASFRELLAAYWTRGPAEAGRFGEKRPFLWHLPKVRCPHCQGTGYIEERF